MPRRYHCPCQADPKRAPCSRSLTLASDKSALCLTAGWRNNGRRDGF
jgi:hypothetical protein